MSKFFRNAMIGGIIVGCGVVAYKKLLTEEAQEKVSSTASNAVRLVKNYVEENNTKSEKDAKIALIKTIDKTESEWSRLGY